MDAVLREYVPADRAWLVAAHGRLYARDEGFDDTFAPLVNDILAAFEAGHDPARETGWVAEVEGRSVGSIFCVDAGDGRAKLRLFLVDPVARGQRLGARLLEACMGFAQARGYRGMVLWTHAEHRAACALYQRAGWRCLRSEPVRSFGVDLTEQTWEIDFR
ncbi:GNAT family N-acetyltransferase [Pseudaestuariivita atlantica]|uniref:Acetyltransferase n=1 Tax=Pseudaestuariivita atlantica TaxID=1317121 RepID=A0A0L1JVA0_9RHOB|nr:GNAT family N-acetyltransferase [Pseudaestuariivita atlantica]KNG95323.1 acetyltransferase [Pseudaestuariivita atlantica]